MKPFFSFLSTLFIGTIIIGCAGTDSSAQKKGEDNSSLFKAGTPMADSLVSSMPEFAHSVFKKAIDSVPGEYYYHVTDGRIDTLFKKEGGQYKPVASVTYDSLDGQNSYELKKGNYSSFVKDGVLVGEIDFPKYAKVYWDNGKPKEILTGVLYRNDQGVFRVDSGHSEVYFKNGEIKQKNNWKNKLVVTLKEWNKNGVLIKDLDFQKKCTEYWDDGKIKQKGEGVLYRTDGEGGRNLCSVDSGHSEIYFENGQINEQNDWKNKRPVASRQWNESGVLVKEWSNPNYFKKYWDNGKLKNILTGLLYRDDQGVISVDSGHSEVYFENGEIKEQGEWKNKLPIEGKTWYENGILRQEYFFPNYFKEYWDDGKPKAILTGLLYRDDQGVIRVDSGHSEVYFENGKISQQNNWKNKQVVTLKEWNKNGALIKDLDFPKHYKEYWDNGKIKEIGTGILYRNERGNIAMDSGHSKLYFENGKIKEQNDWKDKQAVASKVWNENGVLVKEWSIPNYYKEYWDNGKPMNILTGVLYRDDKGNFAVDSGHSETYFENGKINQQNDWKDKQEIAQKAWNENGVLVKEWSIPNYYKEYWDNGKPMYILTGLLYRDDQGVIRVDSGHSEVYFENGKISQQNNWKNKQVVTLKEWNKNGALIKDLDFPKHYKEYWDNGKIKKETTGLYWSSPTNVEVENGFKKEYYENGQIKEHKNYKDKEPYSSKQWNEDGTLSTEWDISAGYYKYYENGTLRLEAKGFKGFTGEKGVLVETGYQTLYFNNGKPQAQEQFKDKKTIGKKIWDENGTLVIEEDLSKGFRKTYFPNGKISRDISGKFHYEDKKIIFEDCSVKSWYENGQTEILLKYKDKKLISKKYWYENGNIAFSAELPNHYKVFYEDGKIKADITGTLAEENGDFKIKDGTYNEYDSNGEVINSVTYKDFQRISEK